MSNPSEAMKKREDLEELRKEALEVASSLVKKKGADYGHWSEYPMVALAALNFVKAKRMLNLAVKTASNPFADVKNESMEDTCVDAINYNSFMYALLSEGKAKK